MRAGCGSDAHRRGIRRPSKVHPTLIEGASGAHPEPSRERTESPTRVECQRERRSHMKIRTQLVLPLLVMVVGFGVFVSAQAKKPAAKATKVRVFFVEPKNNATVSSPVHMKFGSSGIEISPLPPGDLKRPRPGVAEVGWSGVKSRVSLKTSVERNLISLPRARTRTRSRRLGCRVAPSRDSFATEGSASSATMAGKSGFFIAARYRAASTS